MHLIRVVSSWHFQKLLCDASSYAAVHIHNNLSCTVCVFDQTESPLCPMWCKPTLAESFTVQQTSQVLCLSPSRTYPRPPRLSLISVTVIQNDSVHLRRNRFWTELRMTDVASSHLTGNDWVALVTLSFKGSDFFIYILVKVVREKMPSFDWSGLR